MRAKRSSGVDGARSPPPEWFEVDRAGHAQLAAAGVATPWEKELFHKDGHRVPVLLGAAVFENGAVIGIAIDLTARRQAEVRARQQEIRFRALVENSADGIVMTTVDGVLLYVSPAAARIFGVRADELLGTSLLDRVHPADLAGAREYNRLLVERPGYCAATERRVLRPDGTSRWLEVTAKNMLADPAVQAIVRNIRDITDRKEAAAALHASEARFARLAQSGIVGIAVSDQGGAIIDANDAYLRTLGYSREDLRAGNVRWTDGTPPEWLSTNDRAEEELRRTGIAPPWEKEYFRKDRSRVPVLVGVATLEQTTRITFMIDLTERKRAEVTLRETEHQLRQAQKMEAVGRLAGGVAHDFNNMLSVILSYADLILSDLRPTDPMYADVDEVRKAGARAAELTRQLLLFSRQQVMEPKVVDLNEVLVGMQKMLGRLLGEDVDLSLERNALGSVLADPSGVEQVVMNLVVNARDAMPTGGKLRIETASVELDEAYARRNIGAKPGPYVLLSIADDGVGMDEATQARIFEPFFTTKELGKGTGLGLSTVFGIVTQSGGSVAVESAPGRGATFRIYLPRVASEVERTTRSVAPPTVRGSETILLVEDEDQVRVVARGILARHGYTVLDARNAGEALLLAERHAGTIDLLLSDVVMPQMSGPELARRLVTARPTMRVLCMSGYADDSVVRHGVFTERFAFLQKPVTPETLTRKVREVLEEKRG